MGASSPPATVGLGGGTSSLLVHQVREEVRVGRPFFGLGGGYCRGYPLRERTWVYNVFASRLIKRLKSPTHRHLGMAIGAGHEAERGPAT